MIVHEKKDYDWGGIKSSSIYVTHLQKKNKKNNQDDEVYFVNGDDDDYDNDNDDDNDDANIEDNRNYWRKYSGKKSCRIWYWWNPIVVDEKRLPDYHLSLILVVMVQVPSCAVERVFYQFKYIRDSVGVRIYGDMMEVRKISQCNGDLTPLIKKIYEIHELN